MASPNYSELWAQLLQAVKLLDITRKFAAQNTPNFSDTQDALTQALEGDHAGTTLAAVTGMRQDLAKLLDRGRYLVDPILRGFGRLIGSAASTPEAVLADLAAYFRAQSKTVIERGFNRGAPAAGVSNVGDGTLVTFTEDAFGDDVETGGPFVTRLSVVGDTNTGRPPGSALFLVHTDSPPAVDAVMEPSGIPGSRFVAAVVAADSLLQNASFQVLQSGATHPFPGWYVSGSSPSYAGVAQDTAEFFRADRGTVTPTNPSGTGSSLALGASAAPIKQRVVAPLPTDVPIVCACRIKGDGSADGSVKLSLGGQDETLAVTTDWQLLLLGTTTPSDAWYRNFKDTPLVLQLERVGATAGTVYIDEVILAPTVPFNGRYLLPLSGQDDFEIGDTFTCTDSIAGAEGSTQYWLARLYDRYLPHAASGVATESDYA